MPSISELSSAALPPAAVVLTVSCTVGGVAFSGTETFDVGASAPTALTLTPGADVNN